MARGIIDHDGLRREDIRQLNSWETPDDIPFAAGKISHVVLKVRDLARSVKFYAEVMGFRVSEAYPETMMPGRMVFMRCNNDHHGVALVGGAAKQSENAELHHFAFEVATLDEVFKARGHLVRHGVALDFEGRRRAGQQIALEFQDPDGHRIEICWGMDQIMPDAPARPAEEWREAFSLEDAVRKPPPGQEIHLSDPSLMRE